MECFGCGKKGCIKRFCPEKKGDSSGKSQSKHKSYKAALQTDPVSVKEGNGTEEKRKVHASRAQVFEKAYAAGRPKKRSTDAPVHAGDVRSLYSTGFWIQE